jgi:predicted RNase H-like HicB family nuclease
MRFMVRMFYYKHSYSAMVPDVPGCVAAGDTVEEVRQLMSEALALHLELMQEDGEALPVPTQQIDLHLDELEDGELCTWVEVEMPAAVSS